MIVPDSPPLLPFRRGSALSPGAALIALLAAAAALALALIPQPTTSDRLFLTFAREHAEMYRPILAKRATDDAPALRQISLPALERRLMASAMSGTRVADLFEVEKNSIGRAFLGPLDAVPFLDLTDRLRRDGLLDRINPPSFSPWTSRGRIFGIPHDVHPVMLGYRADILEAAGIDASSIETWDDFERLLRPLMDTDGDGRPDRFLLNMWESNTDHLEVLLLQAGGGLFDDQGRVVIDSEINAAVLARIAAWCAGPARIAADAPNFSASGNRLKAEGFVIASFFPDWMGAIWQREIPQLAGKVKLMPLPAWTPGGRRTSVWGGTALVIPTSALRSPGDADRLYNFAKDLYLSDDLARALWTDGGIITPVRDLWDNPIFDQPSPYFAGQPVGRMYINLAHDVPDRPGSPFNALAARRVTTALVELTRRARDAGGMDEPDRLALARALLADAAAQVRGMVQRNRFLGDVTP
ncbi:MAG: extracellular solute-binding protein [Phycisphaeraceae bacterium]|nr:MAG: extracellular solute-binding protein [Phycisphaeraceae bacterium]